MIEGVRQIKLINSKGEEFDLTRVEVMLRKIQNLGWGQNVDTMDVSDDRIVTKTFLSDKNPSGTLTCIGDDAYKNLEAFRRFIQDDNLRLAYRNDAIDWRYLDVAVDLSHGEKDNKYDLIDANIIFNPKSVWYERVDAYYSSEISDDEGKSYPYSYPYSYAGESGHTIQIENGNLPSTVRIVFIGPVSNPEYRLIKDGNVVATGKINADVPSGKRLVIDTNPSKTEIALYSSLMVREVNYYQYSDFSTVRFFDVPPGQSQIVLLHEGIGDANGYVEVKRRV